MGQSVDPENNAEGKKKSFEETHQRVASWVNRDLKKRFDELAKKRGVTKAALLNEAIETLLRKEHRKPYTRKESRG